MENKKMMNAASTLDTLAKVMGRIVIAVAIVCGVMAILVAIFGEKMMVLSNELSFDLGFVKLYATEALEVNSGFMKAYVIVGLIAVGMICVAVHISSALLHSVLEPMKNGRPFESEIPVKMRKLAWVVLGCGLIIEIANMIEGILLVKAFDIENIVNPVFISKIEPNYTIDLGFVLIFMLIMLLSYIFSYGQKLQQDSDETL